MTCHSSCTQNMQTPTKNPTVFRLIDSTGASLASDNEMTVTGTIPMFGVEKHISIQILDQFARLPDLVPLARALCDAMVSEVIDHSRMHGKKPVCGKKCSACCSYLVPLSIPETILLYEEIRSMPSEESGEFWDNSLSVATHLLEDGSSDSPEHESSLPEVAKWYSDKQVSCPFLKNDLCAIYDKRPLACREYMVTTPASGCRPGNMDPVEKVGLPYSLVEAVGEVAAQLEGTPVEAIMLPLILPWIQENRERAQRKWSAQKMAQCLLNVLGG
ncbi:MAG: YkgJ family cysteine cluster protein [Phycisphaeraceae bacterium]|nr:YkgJ family cysteine cluster protein [Phycisphaeraceae bacterium]